MTKLAILGSTGSIGRQALEVIDNINARAPCESDKIQVFGLSAHKNAELVARQALRYKPRYVAVTDADAAEKARGALAAVGSDAELIAGDDPLCALAANRGYDILLNALVGNAGLMPTLTAIERGRDIKTRIALANKETLVAAGEIVMRRALENGVPIIPVDSEHSAVFQCLQGNAGNGFERIYLTASGGPFRETPADKFAGITPAMALRHPNWDMGAKITVDSATMMNKGLEVIEAMWLFGADPGRIRILVHPQSVVHSMVEFRDGSVIAQLGAPDMRLPIQYALTYPRRLPGGFSRFDPLSARQLAFEPPDFVKFPCLRLAYEAIAEGGTLPAAMNAADEAAVGLFLKEKIAFTRIPELIESAMKAYTVIRDYDAADVIAADAWAREFVRGNI